MRFHLHGTVTNSRGILAAFRESSYRFRPRLLKVTRNYINNVSIRDFPGQSTLVVTASTSGRSSCNLEASLCLDRPNVIFLNSYSMNIYLTSVVTTVIEDKFVSTSAAENSGIASDSVIDCVILSRFLRHWSGT